jgi:hypothetical protein
MILSALFGCVIMLQDGYSGSYEKTTIGNTDDCRLTTLVNSASTAPPISLPPKGAKFRHTSNILFVGVNAAVHYGSNILIPLQLVGRWLLVVGRSVHNKGCRAIGGFPPKG